MTKGNSTGRPKPVTIHSMNSNEAETNHSNNGKISPGDKTINVAGQDKPWAATHIFS